MERFKKNVVSISEIKLSLDLDSQDPEGLSKHTVQNADFCLCLHDSRQNVHQLLELCVKFCPVFYSNTAPVICML